MLVLMVFNYITIIFISIISILSIRSLLTNYSDLGWKLTHNRKRLQVRCLKFIKDLFKNIGIATITFIGYLIITLGSIEHNQYIIYNTIFITVFSLIMLRMLLKFKGVHKYATIVIKRAS